jgi:DNA-binding XRE family transcriptional regulator
MRTKRAIDVMEEILGPPTFGGMLRGLRASRDMSQTNMAKFLGISKSSLCDIEKGRQFVSVALAAKIAKKCQVPPTVAVKTALNDQLRRAGLSFTVELEAS